jgi:hypothetical protein
LLLHHGDHLLHLLHLNSHLLAKKHHLWVLGLHLHLLHLLLHMLHLHLVLLDHEVTIALRIVLSRGRKLLERLLLGRELLI